MDKDLIIGLIASILSAITMVPQLIKLIKEKDAESLSVGMLITLIVALSVWIYYGVLKDDWIIIASNTFSVTLNLVILFLAWKYKKDS